MLPPLPRIRGKFEAAILELVVMIKTGTDPAKIMIVCTKPHKNRYIEELSKRLSAEIASKILFSCDQPPSKSRFDALADEQGIVHDEEVEL